MMVFTIDVSILTKYDADVFINDKFSIVIFALRPITGGHCCWTIVNGNFYEISAL